MKKTTHYKGHRWTTEELKILMAMWAAGESLDSITQTVNATQNAILKQVQRMRREGIPLARRKAGHTAGRSNKPWSQGEVEYLIRRRAEKATADEIALELGRSGIAVS